MKLMIRKLQAEWPAWLAISFFAFLPLHRMSEVPLSIFALLMPWLAFSEKYRDRTREVLKWMLPLFLCYWLPMFFSSFDSYDPGKSWTSTAANVRFLMAATSIAVLLNTPSLRWRVLMWTALILLFWAADGFVQLIFGYDLFGIPAHEDRLNALFFKKYQFYGPVMAMLSPLLLEYARRRWHGWAWVAAFALVMGAVMIAGMRSGWVAMVMVMAVYGVLMLRPENRELRKITLSIPIVAVLVIALTYAISPHFQERVATTMELARGTDSALETASSNRGPIFRHALEMYRDQPVNGVGVRAFPAAYLEYAEPDDPHVAELGGARGARHAHNVVLEVMADTGTIGLVFLFLGWFTAWRCWKPMKPDQKQEALPYVLALGLILFPFNTHFAIYGTFISSLIWVLVGLWFSSMETDQEKV